MVSIKEDKQSVDISDRQYDLTLSTLFASLLSWGCFFKHHGHDCLVQFVILCIHFVFAGKDNKYKAFFPG